jgi:hypothetical protein
VSILTDNAPAPARTILFDAAFILFNLLWYWMVAYGVVKLVRSWKPWDGF